MSAQPPEVPSFPSSTATATPPRPGPSQMPPHVPRSTASFHLVHMISSILDQRGFTGCQAGVLAEMERMLEDHIANLFTQAHILAEHASRLQPSPVDILESLSHSYLSRVDPHLFDPSNFEDDTKSNSDIKNPDGTVAAKPDPNTNQPMEVDIPSHLNTEHLTQEEQAQALQASQWKTRDAIERRVHAVVLESYQAPVRDLKSMVARSRRGVRGGNEAGLSKGEASGSGKEGGTGSVYDRVLVPLPLALREITPEPQDPYTISLSDDEDESDRLPSITASYPRLPPLNKRTFIPADLQDPASAIIPTSASNTGNTESGAPSTPLPAKRRRRSTIHRLDALSDQLSTSTYPGGASGIRVKDEPAGEGSAGTSNAGKLDSSKSGTGTGTGPERENEREIKMRKNERPGYMLDVPWVPGLPGRHRWRKTFERTTPDTHAQPHTHSHTHLTNKTLEYLTSSVQSTASSSALHLFPEPGAKRRITDRDMNNTERDPQSALSTPRGTEVVTRHTVPLELAPVNYHTSHTSASSGSFESSAEGLGSGSGASGGAVTGTGTGMMDSPLAQGAGFSLGDEVFDRVVRNGGRGGQAGFGRRRRWVVV
ncbi:hypothetical protein HD553DRAFT_349818 [Filobasidium floriforme]|uniref:uncharacterized protein n=1 Tax=Filobasidium floriforme TaxID=5210 RepID=UPI001E8DBA0D|nr:uncharacterized protein HD553DRAFT_349818 [Filobasidium floriforme]KAH8085171.1 hypothetical protein HD553DRAFT_349818 [Filobasidium floriforme]